MLGFDVISLLTLQLDAAQSKVKTFAPRLDPSSLYHTDYQGVEGGIKISVATRPLSVDSFNPMEPVRCPTLLGV